MYHVIFYFSHDLLTDYYKKLEQDTTKILLYQRL